MNQQYEPGYDPEACEEPEEILVKCDACNEDLYIAGDDDPKEIHICTECADDMDQKAEDDAYYRRTGYSPYDF